MLRAYYQLAKPGIVYGNLLPTIAAFLFATRWQFSVTLLLATVVSMALVVASACVYNNWYDRDIDRAMERTRGRPLAAGAIAPSAAIVYGAVLGIVGFGLLWAFVNMLTVAVAFAGWFIYVFCYTPLKHKSSIALYVGAAAGAMPIVAGYTAGAGRLDLAAFLFFLFLFLWQLPHFIAIAAYRFDEYRAAGVPLVFKHAPTEEQKRLGRNIFLASLIVLVIGCVSIALIPFF